MDDNKNIKLLKYEMLCFMYAAKNARDLIFSTEKDKVIKCLSSLTKASNHLCFAKSIYIFGIDDKRQSIDDLFNQADIFFNEITTNIETDHSHQWSDIEFNNLVKVYDYSELCEANFFPVQD